MPATSAGMTIFVSGIQVATTPWRITAREPDQSMNLPPDRFSVSPVT
jgi:hypothetical protein